MCKMIQRYYLLETVRVIHTMGKARNEKKEARDRS